MLWNHDLQNPQFFTACRACGTQIGPFDSVAKAQAFRGYCDPCHDDLNAEWDRRIAESRRG